MMRANPSQHLACSFTVIASTLLWPIAASGQANFFISPTGNDANAGTLAQPFASLTRARDAVRQSLASGQTNATVEIRGGLYRLNEPVVFGLADSTEGRVTYKAYNGETPVFSGGVEITGWTKLTTPLEGLPAASAGKIWVADMPAGLDKFTTLFSSGVRLPRSRSENMWSDKVWNDANEAAILDPGPGRPIRSNIYLKEGFGRNWPRLSDIELLSRSINWSENGYLPLRSINLSPGTPRNRYAETVAQGTNKLEPWNAGSGGTPTNPYAYFENAVDYLDSEGDWCVDTLNRKVYIFKAGNVPPTNIEVPKLTELIRVEGQVEGIVDHEAMFLNGQTSPVDIPVRGITFEGLTFKHGERGYFQNEVMIQHWWDGWDKSNALLRFRGAENCIVKNCRFTESGGNALRFDFHAINNQVIGNEIGNMGMSAILILGYGPGTKDVSKRNRIVNNYIHDCGELIHHSQMIVICQSGENQVAHNLIREVPRKAICLTGPRVPQFNMKDTNGDGVIDEFGKVSREWNGSMRWHEILPADTNTTYSRLSNDAHHYDRKPTTVFKYLHSRNNLVEYNLVTRACQKLNDGANINMSGVGTGNVVRNNHVFNTKLTAMRTDDNTWEALWLRNVIEGTSIVAKCENHWVNNIFIDGTPKLTAQWGDFLRSRFEKNIHIQTEADPGDFFTLEDPTVKHPFDDFDSLKTAMMDRNVFYRTQASNTPSPHIVKLRTFNPFSNERSLFSNPLLVNLAQGDYRLSSGSPARNLRIQSIDDLSLAGLLDDFPVGYRSTIPATPSLQPNGTRNWAGVNVATVVASLLTTYGPGGSGDEPGTVPEHELPLVRADFVDDFPQSSLGLGQRYAGSELPQDGWGYFWNPSGSSSLGNPSSFQALVPNTTNNAPLTAFTAVANVGASTVGQGNFRYGYIGTGGRLAPGPTTGDYRAIVSFTVQPGDQGIYHITGGRLSKDGLVTGNGVSLSISVNGVLRPHLGISNLNQLEQAPFSGYLGNLNAGDRIDVMLSHDSNGTADASLLDFSVSRIPTSYPDYVARGQHGLTGFDANLASDIDDDGIATAFELLMGGDPSDPTHWGRSMQIREVSSSTGLEFHFIVDEQVHQTLNYRAEISFDLVDWELIEKTDFLQEDLGSGQISLTIPIPPGQTRAFGRLVSP